MPNSYKSALKSTPQAFSYSSLYIVPADTETITSNIHVCNTASTNAQIKIALHQNSASPTISDHIFHGIAIAAYDTIQLGDGITLNEDDEISVWSNSGNVNFILSYAEVTE